MIRIALAIAALVTLTACETMQGAGRDIESAGEALQQESAEAQANM
ncbi:entericidin A/B family lipoprotein [Frigidibacter oleivorans]|nr:entericidin A/B family lipoprotein [Frigidibacter oleivorans]